jgi:(p)ppGpp synthase/HD superfamily hydrolase
MELQQITDWCIDKHKSTNHMYDKYLPYEFHLRMVEHAFYDWHHLLPNNTDLDVLKACWGHDLIEDCRVSYNDCTARMSRNSADIIYAVTNEKGKNRLERANSKYYEGIRSTPGAVFVKLCDRIANVQYSKMTKSIMYDKYKDENPHFLEELGCSNSPCPYITMMDYLVSLFDN